MTNAHTSRAWLSIVGIGEDGWEALHPQTRALLEEAEIVVGGARQLALAPQAGRERIVWPSPMLPFIDELITRFHGRNVVVLASGDPMLYGIGAVFAQRLNPHDMHVVPHVSSFALACARLRWPSAEVALISTVARPLETVHPYVQPSRRLVVFSEDGETPARLAKLLNERGYGSSRLTVFESLGGAREVRYDGVASTWSYGTVGDLNLVAVECVAERDAPLYASIPGLPDDAFETDGQLTKREVRAVTLARLVPLPGALLWDIGAGSGSIGIEWMRAHPSCRAVAFEIRADRAERIRRNAQRLGVPGLVVVNGAAPEVLARDERPDAIFIGGGITAEGVIETCLRMLAPGGRLVANVVTIEGETAVTSAQAEHGGELIRLALSRAEPIGSMLTWRPLLPVTQWIR